MNSGSNEDGVGDWLSLRRSRLQRALGISSALRPSTCQDHVSLKKSNKSRRASLLSLSAPPRDISARWKREYWLGLEA